MIDIFDDRMEIYSPGGMADGIAIQDRDPLSVPSTRRNPLLADIFERLGYMERKGSGFGKIIDAYEFQVNYTEDKIPYFRSDRAGFVAVMPNLNYDVPQDVPQGVAQGVLQGDHRDDHQIDEMLSIKNMISANGNITVNEMADKLGVSPETVRRRIKKDSRIKYVGSGYSGHWEIEE